jgi:uncharacterized membrane protein YeaQ/YmgE (transglycosylase-associated protein family)
LGYIFTSGSPRTVGTTLDLSEVLMGILGYIVVGLIVGALAKMIMPGRDGGGIILTIVLGVVGAFVGGIIGKYIFHTDLGGFFNLRTWVLALVGSIVVLGIYRLVSGRGRAVRR